MSITLTWAPNSEPDIASYDWQRAPDSGGVPGTWADLVTIDHDLNGPNYNTGTGLFFYKDTAGSNTDWYRVRSVDTGSNASAYSLPFQPAEDAQPPPFPNTVALSEDYGGTNALRYEDEDGVPINEAQVRVYRKVDYDLEDYGAALGVTVTDTSGGWVSPVTVEAGQTYTIEFFKPGAFGPDIAEVVVP